MNTNKLRLFSAGWSFIDNNGKPLLGEVSFYDKDDTTQPCDVYDSEGTVISNPIQTTDTGRTVQPVYLENDKIYTVFFYKYTESGNKELQYSVEIPKNTFVFDFGSDTQTQLVYFPNVATMTSSHYPWREDNVYGLLGYYESGDTDVVYYKAKRRTNGDPNPNGGSVLVGYDTDGTAYTLLLNSFYNIKYFDVRHFGVVPSMHNEVNNSSLALCDSFCHDNGYIMSFTKNGNDTVYTFRNLQYTFLSTIYATSDITLYFVNSNVPRFELDNCRPVISADNELSGQVIVYGDELWLSTKGSENVILNPSIVYYIDAEWSQQEINAKNCQVVIQGEYSNTYNLDNCNIISNHYINTELQHTFHNCTLDVNYFTSISNYFTFANNQNLYNNKYIGNWPVKALLFLEAKDNAYTIIDLQGLVVLFATSDAGFVLNQYGAKTLKNATLRSYMHYATRNGHDIGFENVICEGDGSIVADADERNPNINTVKLTVKNSTIKGSIHVRECLFENSTLYDYGFINCLSAGIFINSVFEEDTLVETGYDSKLYNNIIKSHVDIWPSYSNTSDYSNEWSNELASPSYSCEIMNNTFDCANTIDHGFVYFMRSKSDETVLPEYSTYVSKKVRIANNVIVELPGSGNTTYNPPISDASTINTVRFVRFDPTRILQFSGAYVYSNNTGDGFGSTIVGYFPVMEKTQAQQSKTPVISFDLVNQIGGNMITLYMYASQFMFCFGELYSKRMWNAHVTVSSKLSSYRIDCPDDSHYSIIQPTSSEVLFDKTNTVIDSYIHISVDKNKFLLSRDKNNPLVIYVDKNVNVGDTIWLNIEIKEDAWLMTHVINV